MKRLAALAAIVFAVAMNALPAAAAQFVQDGAGMFSSSTVSQLDTTIRNFNAQTQKEVVVVTVPSLNGETVQNAAQTVFSEQGINGVLIFIAKAERKDIIVPGRTTAQFFPASTTTSIREQMESSFRNGDFDGGITTAVSSVLDVFRSHLNSLSGNTNAYGRNYPATTYQRQVATRNGTHISMFVWIILIVVGFLIIRSIFRAMSGPRYYGGPGGPGAPMGGGPGYGPGPGYGGYGGPGYYGGGGGGFWSGLLGGLGGAWLGNEMFNRGGGGGYVDPNVGGGVAPVDQGGGWGGGNAPDAGGWGNDAGQADMGSSSAGDWGGGGFGGGDFGGGGGGDFGGGGGDSGGGW